jgi:putative membrane protein
MFPYDHDLSAWGWVGMTLGMVAFWALVIGAVVWLVRGLSRGNERRDLSSSPDPRRVLAERFARGEIDEAEYRDRLTVLSGAAGPAVRS